MDDADTTQASIWSSLFDGVAEVLAKYGHEDPFGRADYSINSENYGWKRVQVVVDKFDLFQPKIVDELRRLVRNHPGWEITMALSGGDKSWPLMGVTIRKHEIVDGLQREYLPQQFQSYSYADSRRGTGYD